MLKLEFSRAPLWQLGNDWAVEENKTPETITIPLETEPITPHQRCKVRVVRAEASKVSGKSDKQSRRCFQLRSCLKRGEKRHFLISRNVRCLTWWWMLCCVCLSVSASQVAGCGRSQRWVLQRSGEGKDDTDLHICRYVYICAWTAQAGRGGERCLWSRLLPWKGDWCVFSFGKEGIESRNGLCWKGP